MTNPEDWHPWYTGLPPAELNERTVPVDVLRHIAPYWDDPNPKLLRRMMIAIGDELELFCQRCNVPIDLMVSVAYGLTPDGVMGMEALNRINDGVRSMIERRRQVVADSRNARLVYEKRFGTALPPENVVRFGKE